MERLCLENRKQTRSIAAMPSSPVYRPMSGSAYHFEDQFALLRRGSGNAESILDLLRSFLDIFLAGVVQAAKHCAGFNFLADLHFENDADRGIYGVFLQIPACANHRRRPANSFGIDSADVSGARRSDFANAGGIGQQLETIQHLRIPALRFDHFLELAV